MRIRAAWNIMNAIYGCRQPATEPSKKKMPTKTNIEYEEVERKKRVAQVHFCFQCSVKLHKLIAVYVASACICCSHPFGKRDEWFCCCVISFIFHVLFGGTVYAADAR